MTSSGILWTDEELEIAVRAYLYILHLEQKGIPYSLSKLIKSLTKKALPNRNEASIRYRMRNITYVLQQLNWPIIDAYYPAENVGAGVRGRIETIISSLPHVTPCCSRYRFICGIKTLRITFVINSHSRDRPIFS